MDTTQTITHIGLCAGYGGIELGLKRVLPTLRTVALCEIEAFACANLVAKMEAGLMDPAPIWTDLKTFPWADFCDRVDILTGGYPCQPFSAAGKRLGADDPRHLWPYIASVIRILKPRACFFENVEGHITLGLSSVISDLEELGYRATWGIFSAAECNAPHQRKRVFIFATNSDKSGIQRYWNNEIIKTIGSRGKDSQTSCSNEFATIKWKSESECGLIGKNDGSAYWMDRVRLLGNGVVPATASKAFETLIHELHGNN